MHLTTTPVASIMTDNEARDYNIITERRLVASTTSPFDAVRAVINLENRRARELEVTKLWLLGGRTHHG